ncbi:MAG: hypothetical protein ACM3VZ_11380 [Acidobacteriota bacterium]
MTQLVGFAPDADPTTAGVVTDCTNMIPAVVGMESAPSAATPSGVPALAAACQGAAVVSKLDDTRRVFAGTATKMYELVAGVWTDRSRVGNYTGTTDTVWSITQFGDATLCSNKTELIQRSTAGAFADIATAPKAKVIFSAGAFVMALNINDGTDKPDGWACCAVYDDTSWTPSVSTQATTGRLVATAGPINAGAKLGEYAVAYKARSIYLGQYVGAPVVWDWIQVPGGEAGCVGQSALCDLGGQHFFVGEDNFWLFDGTRPVPLSDGVIRSWFFNNSSQVYKYKTTCIFDKATNRVWVFYVSRNGTYLDSAVVYHVLTKQWGVADMSIEAAVQFVSEAATIDGLTGTIDTLPNVAFDSQYWLAGGRSLSIFNTSHQLQSLTGLSTTSSITTAHFGDNNTLTVLDMIRPRFIKSPSSATSVSFGVINAGDTFTQGTTSTLTNGKFDARQCARWHKAVLSFTGSTQIADVAFNLKPAGLR